MKKVSFFAVLFLISSCTLPLLSQTAFIGDWQGALKVQGMELHLNFHISNVDGSLKASMDSPDQGANGIPVSKISIEKGRIVMDVTAARGKYTGTINKEKNLITGIWSQGGKDFDLSLKPSGNKEKENSLKVTSAHKSEGVSFIGDWQGALKVQGMELHLNFHISNVDGSLKATMDSPDQGANGIPVSKISIEKGRIVMDVTAARGKYTGTINKEKNLITGTWSQGGNDLELCLKPLGNKAKGKRP